MEEIALANAALGLVELLIPRIKQLAQSGQISPEQQQAVRDKYNSLRKAGDAAFAGPEWQTAK